MQRFFSFLFFLVSIFGVNLWQMDSLLRILCPNGASTITDRRQPANSLEIFGFGFGGGSIFLLLDLRNHMRRKPASLPFFFFFFLYMESTRVLLGLWKTYLLRTWLIDHIKGSAAAHVRARVCTTQLLEPRAC